MSESRIGRSRPIDPARPVDHERASSPRKADFGPILPRDSVGPGTVGEREAVRQLLELFERAMARLGGWNPRWRPLPRLPQTPSPPHLQPMYGVPIEPDPPVIQPMYGVTIQPEPPHLQPMYGVTVRPEPPVMQPMYGAVARPEPPVVQPMYGTSVPGGEDLTKV